MLSWTTLAAGRQLDRGKEQGPREMAWGSGQEPKPVQSEQPQTEQQQGEQREQRRPAATVGAAAAKQQSQQERRWRRQREAQQPCPGGQSQPQAGQLVKMGAMQPRSRCGTPAAAAASHGQSLTALTALGTVALYASLRGGISAFHHLRRTQLRGLLGELVAALCTLGATWWLDFGSLLGIHRDGDLILHDNDVDVAVLEPDWDALQAGLRTLLPRRYSVRIVVPSDDPTTRFIRVYCALGMADVFGARPAAAADRVLVDCGHGSCTEISRAAVLPTGVLTWRGIKLSVPGDIEAALVERYGSGWRVPRYMDKGADVVEGQKLYARIFRALASLGIRL